MAVVDHNFARERLHVNERFADVILERCGPDSRVWVHDFHLMLLPAMLRRRAPNLSIGSAIPATSYATAGTPAPRAWRSAPLWSSSGR